MKKVRNSTPFDIRPNPHIFHLALSYPQISKNYPFFNKIQVMKSYDRNRREETRRRTDWRPDELFQDIHLQDGKDVERGTQVISFPSSTQYHARNKMRQSPPLPLKRGRCNFILTNKNEPALDSRSFVILSLTGIFGLCTSIYGQWMVPFITLEIPLIPTLSISPIYNVGLFSADVCAATQEDLIAESSMSQHQLNETILNDTYNPYVDGDFLVEAGPYIEFEFEGAGCSRIYLENHIASDKNWVYAKVFGSCSIWLGIGSIFSLYMCFCMDGKYLPCVGGIFFVTYLCQVFIYIIFDSNLCVIHYCSLARGGISSMISCMLWLGAGLFLLRLATELHFHEKARKKKVALKRKRVLEEEEVFTDDKMELCAGHKKLKKDMRRFTTYITSVNRTMQAHYRNDI